MSRSPLNLRSDPAEPSVTQPNHPPAHRTKSGPRLTKVQREQVRLLMAQYMDIALVQAVLHSDYPDIPHITDRYLREIREQQLHQQDASVVETLTAERRVILTTGLADRVNRITERKRLYARIQREELAEPDAHRRTMLRKEQLAVLAALEHELDGVALAQLMPPPQEPTEEQIAAFRELVAEEVWGSLIHLIAVCGSTRPGKEPDVSNLHPRLQDAGRRLFYLVRSKLQCSNCGGSRLADYGLDGRVRPVE